MDKKSSPRFIFLAVGLFFIAITGFWMSRHDLNALAVKVLPTATKPEIVLSETETTAESQAATEAVRKRSRKAPAKQPAADPDWAAKAAAALNDPDFATRVDTVRDLRWRLSRESVELLAQFVNDANEVVASEAIDALGYIASNSDLTQLVYEILAQKALDRNFLLRGHALMTAAVLAEDDRILNVVSEFAGSPDEDDHVLAARTLSYLSTPACMSLIETLLEVTDSEEVMREAAIALARIGTPDAKQLLEAGLASEDEQWQNISAWALSRTSDPEQVAALTNALANDQLNSNAVAVVASSPASAQVFGELLSSNDFETDDKIAWLDAIAKGVGATAGSTRTQLADVLGGLVAEQGTNPQKQVNEEYTAALLNTAAAVSISQPNEELTEAVEEKLTSGSFLVQEAALGAFIQLCTPANYKKLLELYWDEDEQIRRTAFFFSEQFLNDEEDIETLKKAKEHEDELIARSADVLLKNVFRESL